MEEKMKKKGLIFLRDCNSFDENEREKTLLRIIVYLF